MKKIIKKLGYVSGYTWPNFLMIFYLKDKVAIVHTKVGFGIIEALSKLMLNLP